MVIAGFEGVGGVPTEILSVAGQVLPDLRQHDLPVRHRQQAHHGGEHKSRAGDPPAGHASGEQGCQFVVAFQPGEREHGAGQ